MHDLGRDPKTPDPRVGGQSGDARAGGDTAAPGADTSVCPLCDLLNDTFVAPRQFVLGWRVAGDPAAE